MEEEKNNKIEEEIFNEYINKNNLYSLLSESHKIKEYVSFLSGNKDIIDIEHITTQYFSIFPFGNTIPTIKKIEIIKDKIKYIEKEEIIPSLLKKYFCLIKNIDITNGMKNESDIIYFNIYLNKFMCKKKSYKEMIELIKFKINNYYDLQLKKDFDI